MAKLMGIIAAATLITGGAVAAAPTASALVCGDNYQVMMSHLWVSYLNCAPGTAHRKSPAVGAPCVDVPPDVHKVIYVIPVSEPYGPTVACTP